MLISALKKYQTSVQPKTVCKLILTYTKLEAGNSSLNIQTSNTRYVELVRIELDQLFTNNKKSDKSHNSSKQGVIKGKNKNLTYLK